jgi:crotonobetainyl-CoA:carnitine CoA-transferase CaiB-like acyl-CoA transferase
VGTTFDGDSVFFHANNRNKKSVVLDIKDEGDVAHQRKL